MCNSLSSPGLPRPDAVPQPACGGHARTHGAFRQRWTGRQGCLRVIACAVSAGLLLLSGCAPLDARKDAKYLEKVYAADRPVVRPVRSISSFSDSLMCMDRMFRNSHMPTVLITSKQLPDYSGRVAVAAKEMVVTALSQMSRVSSAFRYVDYEVDIARQDTVQNLTTILLNNNQIQLQRPALYVSGAVSFMDQNVLRNSLDAGTSASRLETGYSSNRSGAVLGMELHLGDFRTRTIIPGLDSANEVVIGNGSQGLDLSGRIGNYGVQFSVGRDYAQGSGPAVRTLVELGMIELLGKWSRLPYWQCLTLDQTHPDFQRQLRDWYEEGDAGIHQELVRQSLISKGYLPPDAPAFTAGNPQWREAIGRFQADSGMVVNGVVDFSTYERALRDFVAVGADGHMTRIGWDTKSAAPVTTATDKVAVGTGDYRYGAPAPDRQLDLWVENITPTRTSFETGEQLFLSATVSRASYLACFMAGADGEVTRLVPNDVNRSGWITAAQSVRLPDWMSPNPGYVINAGPPGKEGVACFATEQNMGEKLPQLLQGKAFIAIPGMRTLEDVNRYMAESLGTERYTGMARFWQVVPAQAKR
nr:DUF4384 domain-containing protein [Delftia tsuruhatensis]